MRRSPARRVFRSLFTFGLLALPLGVWMGCGSKGGGSGGGSQGGGGTVREISDTPPPTPREFRAAFVTMAYNFDWPSSPDLVDEQAQKEEIAHIVARARELNLNVIILQVRAFGDRIHKNHQHGEPWSRFLNKGAETTTYDPLCEWVRVCHENGIELHAWVNPFRFGGPAISDPDEPQYPQPFKEKKHYWQNPTDSKVHKRIVHKIIKEILNHCPPHPMGGDTAVPVGDNRMRVESTDGDPDGILIDHYIPEPPGPGMGGPPTRPSTTTAVMSNAAKRAAVTDFVKVLYDGVRNGPRKHVKVGLSPKMDPFGDPMADVPKWLANGHFHYMVPELYVRAGVDFNTTLGWYLNNNPVPTTSKPRPIIVPGLFTVRVLKPESSAFQPWSKQEITDQIVASRAAFGTVVEGGQAHYGFTALRAAGDGGPPTSNNIGDALKAGNGVYAKPALVPNCVSAQGAPPMAPKNVVVDAPANGMRAVKWSRQGKPPWLWVLWARERNTGIWRMQVIPGIPVQAQVQATVPDATDRVVISGVDKFNRQGAELAHNIP